MTHYVYYYIIFISLNKRFVTFLNKSFGQGDLFKINFAYRSMGVNFMTNFIELHRELINTERKLGANRPSGEILVSVAQIVSISSNEERKDTDFKVKFEKSFPDDALSSAGCKLELSTGSTLDVCECEKYIHDKLRELGCSIS